LLRQFGSSAAVVMLEALDDAEREVASFFDQGEEHQDVSDTP